LIPKRCASRIRLNSSAVVPYYVPEAPLNGGGSQSEV
jgi:hypothetical protein